MVKLIARYRPFKVTIWTDKNQLKFVHQFQMRRWLAIADWPMRGRRQVATLLATAMVAAILLPAVGTERRFYPSHKADKEEVIAVKESRHLYPNNKEAKNISARTKSIKIT
jgi:hypothetical protein